MFNRRVCSFITQWVPVPTAESTTARQTVCEKISTCLTRYFHPLQWPVASVK